MQYQNKMSKNIKGKSNGFKSLVQEVKRKQKAEEIVKAIQKIQNQPNQKEQKQAKQKHFKIYSNSHRNIKAEIECDKQANEDALQEIRLQQLEEMYLEQQERFSGEEHEEFHDWSRRQEEQEFDFDHSSVDWSDDYYENSSDSSCTEELEPIVPKQIEFESRIYDLETKLSAAQETIFQLLGGLFNQETQNQTLDNHMKFLYAGRTLTDEEIEESRWPTTRQGDENAERIEQLEKDNALLKEKLEATQSTVYHLIGGLYNQHTQRKMLNKNIDSLFSQNQDVPDEDHEENKWPTTRQGDANEARIQQLEENIDILVKRLKQGKPLHRFYRKFQKK